jgi:hypothetical protein
MSGHKSQHPQNNPAPDPNSNRSKKESTNRHVYVEPGAQIDFVEDLRKEYRANQDKSTTHSEKQLFWTKVAAFLLLLTAGLTGWQGRSSQKAADAAKSAAETAKQTLIETNRSWMEIQMGEEWRGKVDIKKKLAQLRELRFPLTYTNIGRFPIKGINLVGCVEILNANQPPSFVPNTFCLSLTENILFPGRSEPFEVSRNLDADRVIEVTPELRNDLDLGKKYIVISVHAIFVDAFGRHWVQFCIPVAFANGMYTDKACFDYNDTGDNPKLWP